MKKPETKFAERVRRDLLNLPDTWVLRTQQLATRGIPDFLLCCNGVFVAIELKKDKRSKLTPLQEYTLEAIADCGGAAFLSYPENWEATLAAISSLVRPSAQEPGGKHPSKDH